MNENELVKLGYKHSHTQNFRTHGDDFNGVDEWTKDFADYTIRYIVQTNYFGGRADLYVHIKLGSISESFPTLTYFATGFADMESFEKLVSREIYPAMKRCGINLRG